MRHVHGLTFCPKAFFSSELAFSFYPPSLIISRSLSTPSSWSIRRGNKKPFVQCTTTNQVSPKTSETVDVINIDQPEPLPSTSNQDTVVLAQKKQEVSPVLPQEAPDSTKNSFEPLNTPRSASGLDSGPEYTQKYNCAAVLPVDRWSIFSQVEKKTNKEEQKASKPRKSYWKILSSAVKSDFSRKGYFDADVRMGSYIQFITTPTSDTPGTALLLHFDDKRYIIGNAHEGLQRACLRIGGRLSRSRDILLTGRTEWKSTGGLLGVILSCADATNSRVQSRAESARLKFEKRKRDEEKGQRKKKKNSDAKPGISPSSIDPGPTVFHPMDEDPTMRIHGGRNLTHTLATARSFIFRTGTPIKVLEHIGKEGAVDNAERNWEPTWSDDKIQVWAMPILPIGVSGINEEPKPESPRKRSLGEFMTGERPGVKEVLDQWSVQAISPEGQEERKQHTRELAVSEMFSSAWSLDNLIEKPLREVKMPATMLLRDPATKELTRYEGPPPDGTAPMPDINVLVRSAWPGNSIDHIPPTKPSSTAMSYIIRTHRRRGKFNKVAATERNVPQGPLWRALASGSPVGSSDGQIVTPDMVLEPSIEGSGVAVIDLPSNEYIHNLVHRSEWRAEKVMSGIGVIVWILGAGVAQDQTLLRFIEGQPGLQHIISSPERCPNYLSVFPAAFAAIRHNQIDPARYAIPLHSNAVPLPSGNLSAAEEMLFKRCQPARRGLRVQLNSKFGVTEDEVVPFLNTADIVQETPQHVLTLSQAARKEISSPAFKAEVLSQNLPSPDAEITCLGTGSATPSQHRNVSATLLRVPGCGSYLLDCGENTLGQLKRLYTAPQLAELLRDLKLIWISHLHADHHLGLTSVIKAWYEEVHGKDEVKRQRPPMTEQILDPAKFLEEGKRLFVAGHDNLRRWLKEYSSVEDFGYDQLVPLVSFPFNAPTKDSNLEWNGVNVGFESSDPIIQSAIRKATGLSKLVSCRVSHCHGAQAVSLTFPTGFKISYSGDCRPSKAFADIGNGSTVLLHEATFDDELQSEAIAKKHSTTSEAIGVGVAMRARRVILTHFSQRYQNIPSISALDTPGVKFEDAEDAEDPSACTDQSIEGSTCPNKPQATINKNPNVLDEESSPAQDEAQPQMQNPLENSASGLPSISPTIALGHNISSNINSGPRAHLKDMKFGVAFDCMRVKVGEIIHLEKFAPAFRELYKETINDSKDRSAAIAFSDDENDIFKTGHPGKAANSEKRTKEEQAGRARKGQVKAAKKIQ